MKTPATFLVLAFSGAALASFNDIECTGRVNNARAEFEVERAWGGSIRDAVLTVWGTRGANPAVTRYRLTRSRAWGTQLELDGTAGLRFVVDLFPDRTPQWGRYYSSRFSSATIRTSQFNCRFPNVRP
jgi:hypothetical protein